MIRFPLNRTVQQAAALPFVIVGGAVELLLVTSRRRKRWIVPKGWPQKGQSLTEAARREAWEEAGVFGAASGQPVGSYAATKLMREGYEVPATVAVFPLLARGQSLDWPEKAERAARWWPLGEACERAGEEALARLLRDLAARDGEKLRFLAEKLAESDPVSEKGRAETPEPGIVATKHQ